MAGGSAFAPAVVQCEGGGLTPGVEVPHVIHGDETYVEAVCGGDVMQGAGRDTGCVIMAVVRCTHGMQQMAAPYAVRPPQVDRPATFTLPQCVQRGGIATRHEIFQ